MTKRASAAAPVAYSICLITPSHLTNNPRLVKEAQALTRLGYPVRIVCGRSSARASALDQRIADPRWRITAKAFGRFEAPRAQHLYQALRWRGARRLHAAGITNEAVLAAASAAVAPELSRAAISERADLYIAHYIAALPAAAAAARRHGGIYAFDAEDFHQGDRPFDEPDPIEDKVVRAIESRLLPGAAYVTAASPLIADAYADAYALQRPRVILNAFARANAPPHWTAAGSVAPGPSLYWFSQTIGPGRGLETAIEAIARAERAPHLYLRGQFAEGYKTKLRGLASSFGVGERLHVLDLAPPSELELIGAQFDLGYAGETGFSTNNSLALGNKLFSYLCSGLPIAASNIASHRAIAGEFGSAMALFKAGDATALAGELDALLGDPARLAQAREHAWRLGQGRFCWEHEAGALLETIEHALANSASPSAGAIVRTEALNRVTS